MKPKLTKKLETLLLMACKQVGSYDPQLVDAFIGEQLTGPESEAAWGFLEWVNDGLEEFPGRRFGHSNIRQRFNEYLKELPSRGARPAGDF